jgi:hypothetical protein
VRGCQLKRWKTRQQRSKNFALDNIRVASFAAGPEQSIASSKSAEFASEHWPTKEKFQELKKPVGKAI